MDLSAPFPTGVAALVLGAGLLGLIFLSLRWLAARQPEPYVASPVTLPVEHEAAGVLVAQAGGGRVLFANDRARELFGLNGQDPNLWRLAQQAQPSNTFLELFVSEGRASLNIGERRVEATSLRVPSGDRSPPRFVVMLRETGQLPELAAADERTVQAMSIISDISRAISSSLDLGETLDAILSNVGRAFQYNIAEITLWDPATQTLRPARYAGERDYERELTQTGSAHYTRDEGFSGWIATRREALLVTNVETFTEARPKLESVRFPFRSYVGVPLLIGENLIGTLELISYKVETYRHSDLLLLNAIAGQAAIAIQNAQLFAEQERRVAELTGLADLTRAIEATADQRELYSRLTADVARLLGVQMVGFLLFDPVDNVLVGQPPFRGAPDIVVDIYRISLAAQGVAERLWRETEPWISNAVPSDEWVDYMGWRQVAETAGIVTTVIAPIILGGRRLGVVQVANKLSGAPFSTQDGRLLTILAAQTANILDNARLMREAQARAEQEEGLRQIAAVAVASTDLAHILRTAMQQAAGLLRFDVGVIALLDEARGELVPHPASVYGVAPAEAQVAQFRTDDPLFAAGVTRTRRPLLSNDAHQDQTLSALYRAMVERLNLSSLLNVPLVIGERGIGELIVGAHHPNAFSQADQQLVANVAAELASAVERARLYAATDQNLQRRVEQLTALTRVGRELNQTLDRERILRLVHDEVLHATRADCGTIVLLEAGAAPDQVALRLGDEDLGPALTPLEREAVGDERLKRVSGLTPASPLTAHAEVQAAMVVPILVQGVVAGLIHLHSRDPEGFDDAAAETATALAAQAAIAVGNAQRYVEQLRRGELLRRRADQLAQLFQISRTVRSNRPLDANLEAIAFGLQEAVGFNVILISTVEQRTRRLVPTASAGVPLATFEKSRQQEQLWEAVAQALRDEFRVSQSYFVPYDRALEVTAGLDPLLRTRAAPADLAPEAWHPGDLLLVPLLGTAREPLGMLLASDPRDGQRPDRGTIETIEIFANQASLAIEGTRLYHAAERRAARLLALHRVIERANYVTDRVRVWQTVAESLRDEMGVDLCLIALADGSSGGPDAGRFVLRGRAGHIRPEVDVSSLFAAASRDADAADVARFDPVLVFNTREGRWAQDPLVLATEVTSFIHAPILSQGQRAGVLFVGARHSPTPFAEEDLELFIILANQLGSALESTRLEADIRQRAAQLAALAEVSRTMTATLRTEDVVETVLAANGLLSVVPYDSVTLWLREGQQLRVAAAQGFENDAERVGLRVDIADSALFAEMAETGGAILVPDVRQDPRFPAGALQPTRSWLGAPLVSKDEIIGALALDKIEAHAYGPQTAQVLMAFANQAAVALDNARLFEESEQRAWELDERSRRLGLLNRVSGELVSTLEVDRIFQVTLGEVMQVLNIEHAAGVTFDLSGRADLAAQVPPAHTPMLNPANPALDRVRESLAPLAVEDVAQDAVLGEARESLLARGVRSLLVVPLVVAGSPIGALQFEETSAVRHFTPSEIELAQTLANQAAVAVQNARLYDETQTRLSELATLNQISRAISATIDVDQVCQAVSEQMRAVMDVDSIFLALYDQAGHRLSFPLVLERGKLLAIDPIEPSGLLLHLMETRAPLLLRGQDIRDKLKELGAHSTGALSVGGARAKSYLGAPLLLGQRVIGVIALQDLERANMFSYEDVRILTTIAAQVAVAVEHARLYAEVRARAAELSQRTERLAFLNRLSATLSASLDLESILRSATEEVTRLFAVDHSGVLLFDEAAETGTVEAEYPEHGVVGLRVPLRGDPLEEELLARRAPVVVSDTASDPRLSPALRQNFARLGIQSILVAPFISQGRPIGSISLDAMSGRREFTPDEIEFFQTIAAQIAVAVTNARFAQELESRVATRTVELGRERERVATLLQITTELSSSLDLDLVLSRALQLVTDAVNAPRGSIFLLDLESDRLIYRAALGRARPLAPGGEPAPFKRNEGLVGWVIEHRQAVVSGDLENDPRWIKLARHEGRHRSALAVPLMANEDALGAMILLSPYANAFDDDQMRLVAAAANQVGAAINNAELYRLIRDQAERLGGMLRGQQVEATKSRAILEGIADGVLVADDEGKVILFNAASERVLGLAREAVVGRPVTEFVGIYGSAGHAWIDAINRWSRDPSTYRPGEFFAQRLELEDSRVISVHLAPVTTGEEYLGSVSVIRDITREVEVDRLKSEFVTNVSHELRTPMTSIKGYADVLLMGAAGPVNAEQAKFLEVIKNNADRLSTLVNDLLDISRIESGRIDLVMRPVHLREVIALVIDTFRGRVDEEGKPITLQAEVPEGLPPVWGDRERVTQVIMNLADNAFNYTHGGGTITLRARLEAADNQVRVEVEDTGVGVAPEDQPRLFDRFYRGEDALVLATAGTGLGLPIAKQLIEMHGGRLWLAHSEVGRGSIFALTLPLAEGRAAEA